jgi:hypothetical protein
LEEKRKMALDSEVLEDFSRRNGKTSSKTYISRAGLRAFSRNALHEYHKNPKLRVSKDALNELEIITLDFAREVITLTPLKNRADKPGLTLYPENLSEGRRLAYAKYFLENLSGPVAELHTASERLSHVIALIQAREDKKNDG